MTETTGISFQDYRDESVRGKRCAIVGCAATPKNMCPKCFCHYCYDHIKGHMHMDKDYKLRR